MTIFQVGTIVSTHDHHPEIQRLIQDHPHLPAPGNVHLDDSEKGFITNLESYHMDPIFALYTGGPSSLIAGGVLGHTI